MARFVKHSLFLAVLSALALDVSAGEENPKIIRFDVPGAGTVAGQVPLPQGTFPYGINDSGAIGGNFQDGSNVLHGFLRTPDGAFIAFDAPGAGTDPFQGTQGFVINSEGAIAGKTIDASFVQHGMVRTRDGTVTTFDAPCAGCGAGQGSFATNINREGAIAGSYVDASNVFHGFLRARDGAITTIDVPGAGAGFFQGTGVCIVDCLDPEGAIVGFYADANNVGHGFLRAPDGAITTIDVSGAVGGTAATGINEEGTIVGGYIDANGVNRGFLRARDGTITKFDVPTAGTGNGQGTIVFFGAINADGDVTGDYLDVKGLTHGFVRDHRHGAITTFDAPGAPAGGTEPISNNAANAITGYYVDASGVGHGFLRTGRRCGEDRHENCKED